MDIIHQLNYFKSLADAYHFDGIGQDLKAIYRKMSDNNLYLAVIGEFNTGKSTFINALLRKRLLKEAILPTTACASYISRGDGLLRVKVEFADSSFDVNEENMSALTCYLIRRYKHSCSNLWEVVDALTSDQTVARDVKSLSLSVPNVHFPQTVIIIDTPGFNPSDSIYSNHYGITMQVVSERADVALILMSTSHPYTNSTKQFLQQYLVNYMHRCIFVLTMGDCKSPEERVEVIDYVKNKLRKDFGLQSPLVFCESAIAMLPAKNLTYQELIEYRLWQNEFRSFEKCVWELMRMEKKVILAEHLRYLVLKLTKEFQKGLYMKKVKMESELMGNSWFSKATIDSIKNNLLSLRYVEYEVNEELRKLKEQKYVIDYGKRAN